MPINIEDLNNGETKVTVEYTIPIGIETLITDEFLMELRNQLMMVFGKAFALSNFVSIEEDFTGTGGFATAFGLACMNTNNNKLYKYWTALEWYDSDIFEGKVMDKIFERKMLFTEEYLKQLILKELKISSTENNNIEQCIFCGGWYPTKCGDNYTDDYWNGFCCQTCADKMRNTTSYSVQGRQEIEKYRKTLGLTIQ